MTERLELLNNFLSENGWDNAERKLLAADASFRNYDRLYKKNETAVLMNAPPPMEDVKPFITVARHLEKLGFSAPHIMAEDIENGFLLLEDMGDNTFTKLLAKGEDEKKLYVLATEVLAELNSFSATEAVPEETPFYDDKKYLEEAVLLPDWYMPAIGCKATEEKRNEYVKIWTDLLPVARDVPETLVLRDYHVDNLMTIENRTAFKACGLLDFQDAVRGPVTYDIMSLLEDARRDISKEIYDEMKQRYLSAFPKMDKEKFDASWAVLGAMRHCKVIGIFTRLCVRDKKPVYLQHIPRLWRLLETSFKHPVLSDIKEWIDINIPKEVRKIPDL